MTIHRQDFDQVVDVLDAVDRLAFVKGCEPCRNYCSDESVDVSVVFELRSAGTAAFNVESSSAKVKPMWSSSNSLRS